MTTITAIDRILNLMTEHGVKASKLTTETGLNHSAITEWKKGKSSPSTDAIVKIASYFNVSTDYLLGLSDEKKIFNNNVNMTNSALVKGYVQEDFSNTIITNDKTENSEKENVKAELSKTETPKKESIKVEFSKETSELLRIFDILDARSRNKILSLAFEFEERVLNA